MSQIIPLGIGSPSTETQLILTGLSIQILGETVPVSGISVGQVAVLIQNVVYALPGARRLRVQSTSTVEVSVNGITWSALANSATVGENTSAVFIRCTNSATCSIVVKKYGLSGGG